MHAERELCRHGERRQVEGFGPAALAVDTGRGRENRVVSMARSSVPKAFSDLQRVMGEQGQQLVS